MVAESIERNVSYVLDQNIGNLEGIEKGLHATVNHMYGDHQNYLENLFIKQMVPQSDKLSKLGSSQANASVKNIIALKAQKTKHYSSSSSLNYRVSSAVLQKNEGYHYISEVVPGLASYSQSFLVNNLLGQEYESHNAVHDARLLLKLITDKGNIFNYLDDLAFSPNYPDQYHLQLCNLKTYSKEINEK
ncbi:unnamed protein product [Mytilus coruscus]|uniref:Uncharacterized protein n=1 Tax=Mytilus coruscus TaxID=42192 RepID=A0A6J8A8N2_MYTCO|nr:unnamed protein product [Mytilus coruscus]